MKIVANNRKAFHDYHIEDKFEAGLELFGWEVKSARAAEVNLADSFVYFQQVVGSADKKVECWLKNVHFAPYKDGRLEEQVPKRDRKLLLNRIQIDKLHSNVKAKGYTCVVTKIYFNQRGLVKAEIALAKGKHSYDKKQAMKERDIKREAEREIKN